MVVRLRHKDCRDRLQFVPTWIIALIFISMWGCTESQKEGVQSVAGTEEVAQYMQQFEGRGDQADTIPPTSPEEVLATFSFPSDMALDLVAAEPLIRQPVELNFDHQGRLWVVQYSQYPYPKGLKVVGIDYHLRAQFDKVPEPPPEGVRGADKITFLEDTDGDGVYDKATDAITGLNIATSVTWGRGRIWVLNPPYLLAYPDPDGDGIPNGKPVVHLKGFGLEDTHAVANSLRWGPDGWLYGAQGSTTLANISSSVTKNVHFKGQAIWRYHPETEVFEIFAEGGGNTFHVEIDEKGRVYSGHNGTERGQHYKQGAYYAKNWGKHGALTNPYAFGYFPHMDFEGERLRFTHAWIKYDGHQLPQRYHGAMLAVNPLHNFVQVAKFEQTGSTFRTVDTERILTSSDHWFRPVDIKAGPDGGVYLADWYDSRLSHIDPRDNWHKTSGRIYRLRGKSSIRQTPLDLHMLSSDSLVSLLTHPNKWLRQQVLRQLGDRKDSTLIPRLKSLLIKSEGQAALESLWALYQSGGVDDHMTITALRHIDPHVRKWAVRLTGDTRNASEDVAKAMEKLAGREIHPEVRSQLAASAKRLPGQEALPILKALILNHQDQSDPHIPLQIWWALESKAQSDREMLLNMFKDPVLWNHPIVAQHVLQRLAQRYAMHDPHPDFDACTRLLNLAPTQKDAQPLVAGILEGLRGKQTDQLPQTLVDVMAEFQDGQGTSAMVIKLRHEDAQTRKEVLNTIKDPNAMLTQRLQYLQLLRDVRLPEAISVLLDVVGNQRSTGGVRQAALIALGQYDDAEIGEKILAWYPDRLRADPDVRNAALELLISRRHWGKGLIHAIDTTKRISPDDLSIDMVKQLKLLGDSDIVRATEAIWPHVKPVSSEEKQTQISKIRAMLRTGNGDPNAGKALFQSLCGACHRLFDEGGTIGPDLTGYDRKNLDYLLLNTIDPNADIREGFVNYRVLTQEGRTLTGRMVARSSLAVTLQTISGQDISLSQDQIKEMEALPVSLMPERLLEGLTAQEIRNLFAFISQ